MAERKDRSDGWVAGCKRANRRKKEPIKKREQNIKRIIVVENEIENIVRIREIIKLLLFNRKTLG